MAKRMREVEERGRSDKGWRAKIVEMGGQTLKEQICKSNPWSGKPCGHSRCFACREGKGGDCRRKDVGYKTLVANVNTRITEPRNMFGRGKEHLRAHPKKERISVVGAL